MALYNTIEEFKALVENTIFPLDRLPNNLEVVAELGRIRGRRLNEAASPFISEICLTITRIYNDAGIPSRDIRTMRHEVEKAEGYRRELISRQRGVNQSFWLKIFDASDFPCYLERTKRHCKYLQDSYHELNLRFLKDQASQRLQNVNDFHEERRLFRELNQMSTDDGSTQNDTPDASAARSTTVEMTTDESSEPSQNRPRGNSRNSTRIPKTFVKIKRGNVSYRMIVRIVNMYLREMKLLNGKTYLSVDKLKFEEKLYAKSMIEKLPRAITCLQVDGTGKLCRQYRDKSRKVDLVVLSKLPSDDLICGIPFYNQVSGASMAIKILPVLEEIQSTQTLRAVACDGAKTNLGPDNGLVTKLEQGLGRNLQRIVCIIQ